MIEALSQNARVVLYRLQSAPGKALYAIPSFASSDDRAALVELEAAGLVQFRAVHAGIIVRTQVRLTDAGHASVVSYPWDVGAAARQS